MGKAVLIVAAGADGKVQKILRQITAGGRIIGPVIVLAVLAAACSGNEATGPTAARAVMGSTASLADEPKTGNPGYSAPTEAPIGLRFNHTGQYTDAGLGAVVMEWRGVLNVKTYEVEVQRRNQLDQYVGTIFKPQRDDLSMGTLYLAPGIYRGRVRSVHFGGTVGNWSPLVEFSVNTKPAAPVVAPKPNPAWWWIRAAEEELPMELVEG